MVTGITVNVKGHWDDFKSPEYRQYQRLYQRSRYTPHSRKDNKQAYYTEHKDAIVAKKAYRKTAEVFRKILF